jgi:hypothetical protein
VLTPAPLTVARYNRIMGGVDKHDKLRSTFSLGKRHKLKKNMESCCYSWWI